MSTEKISLKSIEDQYFNAVGDQVIAALEKAFDSLRQTSLGDAAKATATELQALITSEAQSDTEWVFESLWQAVASVARCVPHRHPGQQLLVQVLLDLNVKEESFKGLDALGTILRDNWIDPTFETVEGEPETYSLGEWLNFNSFTARISQAGIVGGRHFAVWQLRHALEEKISNEATPSNLNRVAVASEWLTQASPTILRRCLEQVELDDAVRISFGSGELYPGLPGYSVRRWVFWKKRLLVLGDTQGPEDAVNEAIDAMEAAMALLM